MRYSENFQGLFSCQTQVLLLGVVFNISCFGQQVALENPSKTPLGLWMDNLNETVVLFRHSLI